MTSERQGTLAGWLALAALIAAAAGLSTLVDRGYGSELSFYGQMAAALAIVVAAGVRAA